jgi:hypothetical protein
MPQVCDDSQPVRNQLGPDPENENNTIKITCAPDDELMMAGPSNTNTSRAVFPADENSI